MKNAPPFRKENKENKKKKKKGQQDKNNKTNKQRNNSNNKKIIQLLPVASELVALDFSLTHVLQMPNTKPYHSWELDGLGLYVRLSLIIDKIMLAQAPSASKLNEQTQF